MEEARIIRHEERKADRGLDHNQLHEHRVGPLRSESRRTLLAYGYCRGWPYALVESTRLPVNEKRIREIIRSLTYKQIPDGELSGWLKGELCKT
jgi:hypothetical protein